MTILNQFEQWLQHSIANALPGQEAQKLMMPNKDSSDRFSIEAKKDARPGAVMILFYENKNEIMFPLIQRPDYDGVHARQMSLPGGKWDEADGSLINTSLRETKEEIGIDPRKIKVIGTLTELYIIASNFNVLPVIGFLHEPPTFIPDTHEVEHIVEVNVSVLLDDTNQKEKKISIMQGVSVAAPYFDVNNHVVWGATSMILSELKCIIQDFSGFKL